MTRRGILPVQDIREAVEVGMISAASRQTCLARAILLSSWHRDAR